MAWNGIFDDGLFFCGFDYQPPANMFTQTPTGSANTVTTPFGYGASWSSGSNPGILLNTNLTTIYVGFRFFTSLPASAQTVCNFFDSTAAGSQVTLKCDGTGKLQFYLGSGTGTPIGSASAAGIIPNNAWTYYEIKVTISATVGVVECRINANPTPVISSTGLNTKNTANTFLNAFIFGTLTGAGTSTFFDDWYMLDNTGSAPLNTYLGDVRVVTDAPTGAGAHTQFTPTNPTNVNWSNVANIPQNPSEFNSDSTIGDIDALTYPPIPFSPTSVLAVQQTLQIELDSAGTRTVVPGARSGGSDFFDTSNPYTPSNGTYRVFQKPWVVDPNTSSAWTVTNAGNAQLEYKINT